MKRVASPSNLRIESIVVKEKHDADAHIQWWNGLTEQKKWNLTANHLKHWSEMNDQEIWETWKGCGYGN